MYYHPISPYFTPEVNRVYKSNSPAARKAPTTYSPPHIDRLGNCLQCYEEVDRKVQPRFRRTIEDLRNRIKYNVNMASHLLGEGVHQEATLHAGYGKTLANYKNEMRVHMERPLLRPVQHCSCS